MSVTNTCDRCYKPLGDGEHGLGLCPFEPRRDVIRRGGFEPYFDIGLGEYVTGFGDIKKHMREKKLDYRPTVPKGWHSERRDKIEARKKAAREQAWFDDPPIVQPPGTVTCDGAPVVLFDHRYRPLRRRIGF